MFDCLFMFSVVTAKELQKWYQGFLKDCPKGVLEKQVNPHIINAIMLLLIFVCRSFVVFINSSFHLAIHPLSLVTCSTLLIQTEMGLLPLRNSCMHSQ